MMTILCCGLISLAFLCLGVEFCFLALTLYRYYHEEEEQEWEWDFKDDEERLNEWRANSMEDVIW